ncbi:MAG: hypothetical protein ACT4OE_09845 [Sphingosinicella sp.]
MPSSKAEEALEQAAKCRRLAAHVDKRTAGDLVLLAEQYEADAAKIEQKAKGGSRPGKGPGARLKAEPPNPAS